jgi:hypothetical protein
MKCVVARNTISRALRALIPVGSAKKATAGIFFARLMAFQ